MAEQVFQLDKESQVALNEAINKLEFFSLYKEYVIAQIMLKHKDKTLRFDPQNKMFFETVQDTEPAGKEDAVPIR